LSCQSRGSEVWMRLVRECRRKVKEMGLSHLVTMSCRNLKEVSSREADVLALYLSSHTLNLMAPKFLKGLKPGTRIVNFDFPIPGWKPARKIEVTPAG
ncbi:MAG TPA: hypothetical protein VKF15_07205, partial [Nitrososphaerales archaeon]|nr:hypothetical protein [Nitrososphaerales archaeon]